MSRKASQFSEISKVYTLPEGQFAPIDFFIKKCRHAVHKLNFNCNTKLSNPKEEWTALINLENRNDAIKAADKGGAIVVRRIDLRPIATRIQQLPDTILLFTAKSTKAY